MKYYYLGIDPSQRHTGLCLLTDWDMLCSFHEIKTEVQLGDKTVKLDMLSSADAIRRGISLFVKDNAKLDQETGIVFVMEKQLSVGGHSSSLQFYMQMQVLETIRYLAQNNPLLVMPLPIQLQSYVLKQHNFPTAKGKGYVAHFKQVSGFTERISEHLVDGYYLAKLGMDVMQGKWSYRLPSNEAPLIPWRIINGDDPRAQNKTGEKVPG